MHSRSARRPWAQARANVFERFTLEIDWGRRSVSHRRACSCRCTETLPVRHRRRAPARMPPRCWRTAHHTRSGTSPTRRVPPQSSPRLPPSLTNSTAQGTRSGFQRAGRNTPRDYWTHQYSLRHHSPVANIHPCNRAHAASSVRRSRLAEGPLPTARRFHVTKVNTQPLLLRRAFIHLDGAHGNAFRRVQL